VGVVLTLMSTFRPERALLHPAWIASLVVLALNDHVLKGAGLLPEWLTGKLSDFSGLMVAPAVLATLVRARGPRSFFACHVAVGLGFALFEISPTAVGAVESVLPVRMWPDLTDLAALVVLPLSYRLFAARAERDARPGLAHALAGVVGLVFCTATSAPVDVMPPAFPESSETFENSIYLHNGSGDSLHVMVSSAPAATAADCDRLRNDPAYAGELEFEHAGQWRLESGRNMPLVLEETASAACVVLGVNGRVVAFSAYELPALRVPFAGRAPSAGEVYWDGERLSVRSSLYLGPAN
jgi:hypothetical protein